MSSEADKSKIELRVFAEFVTLADLAIEMDTVEKRTPPEPDLLCRHVTEGPIAFELVELCDPSLARALASPRPNAGGVEYIRTSDPSFSIVLKKIQNTYITDYPIELLCYTGGRIITPTDVILPTLEPLLETFKHKFTRAWLMSRGKVYSLWN